MEEWKKCSKCKMNKLVDDCFSKKGNKYYKMCNDCREKNKAYIEKMKCEHGKQKHRCYDCTPSAFCSHDRLKGTCMDCKGIGYH